MTVRVSKTQFKARALEYFRQVEATGEPIIVTDHGQPTLEIRPVPKSVADPVAILKGSVIWYDDPFGPAVDPDEWNALT